MEPNLWQDTLQPVLLWGIDKLLSPGLVFLAAWLSIRQARKKLREDAALHLYQKQVAASSAVFEAMSAATYAWGDYQKGETEWQEMMALLDTALAKFKGSQLMLPNEVVMEGLKFEKWLLALRKHYALPQEMVSDELGKFLELHANFFAQARVALRIAESTKDLQKALTGKAPKPKQAA